MKVVLHISRLCSFYYLQISWFIIFYITAIEINKKCESQYVNMPVQYML